MEPKHSQSSILEQAEQLRATFSSLTSEIKKQIVGQERALTNSLIALFCGGHVLLEGVPGLGKTKLVKTLAQCVDANYSRIQFTPDLMPAEILGTHVITEAMDGQRTVEFKKGPVFGNIVLADEINRATPKTQSALLEAMQDSTVTTANQSFSLEQPFSVFATQNPLEMEGTYPLPEAQLDRFFFKVVMHSPTRSELHDILNKTTSTENLASETIVKKSTILELRKFIFDIPITRPVMDYAIRLLQGTHPHSEFAPPITNQYVKHGGSPRGAQSMVVAAKAMALIDGRIAVAIDDIKNVAKASLQHRVQINFKGNADGITSTDVVESIIDTLADVQSA